MYARFYGFRDLPFRVTPDPRLLFRNACYDEAAAALAYGIEQRKGFLSLVGEVGTGKTTLLRHLIERMPPATRTILLLHPTVAFDDLLEYLLQELGIPTGGAGKLGRLHRLHDFLLEHTRAGGNVVLMVDEAQALDAGVLEELRLLSNLETASEKILQILLAGQPELERRLAEPDLRQLRQRIAIHVRLRPLTAAEVADYVRVRLEAVGGDGRTFTAEALARLAEVSGGIPRVVNVLCDACLMTGVAAGRRRLGREIVDEAWADYERLHAPAPPPPASPGTMPPRDPVAPPANDRPEPDPGELSTTRPEEAPRRWVARAGLAMGVAAVAALGLVVADDRVLRVASQGYEQVAARIAEPPSTSSGPREGARDDGSGGPTGSERPTDDEARALIDAYRSAYERRDADRLAGLFAEDATENERTGAGQIEAAYRAAFANVDDVRYRLGQLTVSREGERVIVHGPFRVTYAYVGRPGSLTEMSGHATWEIASRAGEARIVALRWAVNPSG